MEIETTGLCGNAKASRIWKGEGIVSYNKNSLVLICVGTGCFLIGI